MADFSVTNLIEYNFKHSWTINNWKIWLVAGSKKAGRGDLLKSEEFSGVFITKAGRPRKIRFQIVAFSIIYRGENCLAFKLVCLDRPRPEEDGTKGQYQFKFVGKGCFGQKVTISKFDQLPLAEASKWSSCLIRHPKKDLTITARIKLVVPEAKRSRLFVPTEDEPPKYSEIA
jgi:hypothetical protein